MTDLAAHYLEEVDRQLRGYKRMADGAIAQITDDDLFRTLDPESNSIAILIKHLAGNMRSRFSDFLTSDGEKPNRHRDQEFVLGESTRDGLLRSWEQGWEIVFTTLASLGPQDLLRTVTVRGQPHTVLQAFNRQLAHYADHVGQIVLLAKHYRGPDWKTLSVPKGQSETYKPETDKTSHKPNA